MDGNKTIWRQAYNSAKKRQQERISEKNKEGGIDMLRSFGFTVQHGCYYGFNKNGDEVQWSNFTLKPLFHIKDDIRPIRLFEIVNDVTGNNREIMCAFLIFKKTAIKWSVAWAHVAIASIIKRKLFFIIYYFTGW